MSLISISDSEFEEKVLGSERPFVVLYSAGNEFDLKMERIMDRIATDRTPEVQCGVVNLLENPACGKRYAVSATPRVLIFAGGNPVGQLLGLQARDSICQKIDKVLAGPVDELPILSSKELKVRVESGGGWDNAITSGLVAGVVFGLALHHLSGVLAFMVPAAAIGLFIFNDNFRFSWTQKLFAIGLMIAIGLYAEDFMRWAFAK